MKQLSGQIKLIIGLASLCLVSLMILLIIQHFQFRIVKSTPDTNNYPSSMGILHLDFNRPLDSNYIQDSFKKDAESVVKFSFNSSASIEVDGERLKITIKETAPPGKYTLTLNNIRAQDGSNFSADIPFIVKKIEYDKMSKETQKLYDEYSSIAETLPQDPVVNALPHQTDKYKISYTLPREGSEMPATITITMKFFEPGDMAKPASEAQKQEYLNNIRKYRTEALEYLKTNGVDINKYTLIYTETDLREEFPVGFIPPAPEDIE